jgi:solute carrier family 13 (sodium-dependent dicarboxylate transporter), member 2/3/5
VTVTRRTLHVLGAPAAFLLIAFFPLAAVPYAARASLGLLLWMSWWWIVAPVHLAVTGFLPLVVVALFNIVPVASVLAVYAEPLVFLLIGANVLAAVWKRWGLDRRIALVALMAIGTDTRRQIMAWFLVAAVLSSVLPNAVVAAAMMPIIVAMLRFIGREAIGTSIFASALLIAVAWGTSIGGVGTPLGGAHNLLAVQLLERSVLHHEFLFSTWVTRLLPLTLIVTGASVVFLRVAITPEIDRIEGTREYFAGALHELGAMSVPERWGLALFAAATLLAFTRQLYASWLPGLTPAFVFLALAVVSFLIRHRGEPLIEWEFAQANMVWGLILLFAGGSALGNIMSDTGTARLLAERLAPLARGGGLLAIGVFSLLTIVITQVTSNTAAVAIVVPITITTFQGLGLNPVPFVYIVSAAANYGVMLPSSSAGPAIAAGYGVDLKMMAWRGFGLTAVIWALLLGIGYVLVTTWPGFGVP